MQFLLVIAKKTLRRGLIGGSRATKPSKRIGLLGEVGLWDRVQKHSRILKLMYRRKIEDMGMPSWYMTPFFQRWKEFHSRKTR